MLLEVGLQEKSRSTARRRELAEIQVRRFDELQEPVGVAVQQLAELVRVLVARIRAIQVVALAERGQTRHDRNHFVDLDVVVVEGHRHLAHQLRLRRRGPLEADVVGVGGLGLESRIAAQHTCRRGGREDVGIDDGKRDTLIQAELPDACAARTRARTGANVTGIADGTRRRSKRRPGCPRPRQTVRRCSERERRAGNPCESAANRPAATSDRLRRHRHWPAVL